MDKSSNNTKVNEEKKCKWCHKLGHTRRSNKECLHYMKRTAIFNKPEINGSTKYAEKHSYIKMALNSMVNMEFNDRLDLIGRIDRVVANITKLVYLSDQIQYIFVEKKLSTTGKEEKILKLHAKKGGILNQFYSLIQEYYTGRKPKKDKRDPDVVDIVNQCMDVASDMEKTPGPAGWTDVAMFKSIWTCVQYEVSKRSTTIENHMVVNIPLRIKYWIKYKLQHLSRKELNKLADAALLTSTVGEGAINRVDSMKNGYYTTDELNAIRSTMVELQVVFDGYPIDEPSIRLDYLKYLQPLAWLRNKAIESNVDVEYNGEPYKKIQNSIPMIRNPPRVFPGNNEGEQRLSRKSIRRKEYKKKLRRLKRKVFKQRRLKKNKKPPAEPRKKKLYFFRVFEILPHSSPNLKFITMDTMGLYVLDKDIQFSTRWMPPGDNVEKLDLWNKYFKLGKVTGNGQRFGFLIQTDGVSVCTNLRKPKSKSIVTEKGFKYLKEGDAGYKKPRQVRSKKRKTMVDVPQNAYMPLDIPQGSKIIGIDPGCRDIVCASWGKGKRQSLSYSKKQWHMDNGSKMARMKREKWLNQLSDANKTLLMEMPSTKGNVDIQMQALKYRLVHLNLILGYYGHRKFKKLKFFQYGRKQRALARLSNKIIGMNSDDVYIGYCDGKFNGKSNSSTSPTKTIFKALRDRLGDKCRLVHEYGTSIRCSNEKCVDNMDKLKQNISKLWSLKICKRCSRNWNRDVNASSNIRDIFMFMNKHGNGKRPDRFMRSNMDD